MSKTNIPYADYSWSPVVGCTPIASGCLNCWAKRLHNQRQFAWAEGRWPNAPVQYHKAFGKIQVLSDRLDQPLHWRKPRTIFVNSMSDTFHKDVPFEFIMRMLDRMEQCPQHIFLLFTKRWKRAAKILRTIRWKPLPNVHLYFSVSTQAEVDEAVPILLQVPGAVRGLSLEPLLESVNLEEYLSPIGSETCHYGDTHKQRLCECRHNNLDSIIVGCESGPKRRPCKMKWIGDIVGQCQEAGVPVYVKQMEIDGKVCSDMSKFPKDLQVRKF